ncbi:MAG: hypothetical protein NTV03_01075 [Candidatus Nomurabacteria bacterium]|nr:hypothetical protein [Candidatus Nomurabacteria bacterium]
MNNFTLKIKSLLKKFNNFFKINPHKHWNALLYLFFITTSLLILFSLYLLYKIKNEEIFQITAEQQNTPTLLKADLLKNITNLSDKKTKRTLEINNNAPVYNDPSL